MNFEDEEDEIEYEDIEDEDDDDEIEENNELLEDIPGNPASTVKRQKRRVKKWAKRAKHQGIIKNNAKKRLPKEINVDENWTIIEGTYGELRLGAGLFSASWTDA